MDIVKLVDFVKTGELFEKIEGDYEQIVSDFDFGDVEGFEGIDGFVKIDKNGDLDKINKSKTTLFVLDKLLPENISDCFGMSQFTILDLNFGLSSYGNKIGLSKLDLGDLISQDVSVYEPLDLISLLDDLALKNKKYIRINDFDLPGNFTDTDIGDILSMSDSGLSGGTFTIITTGTMLPEIVRVANILNEHGLFVDVFILNKLNFDLDERMSALVTHNDNIMFVLDLMNSDNYEKWVKNKIKGVNIKFIYPEYTNLSTVFGEYRGEECGFDAEGLVNRLK